MDLELTGKTALVTGASKGIGKAIARGLAHEGVRVAVCSRDATTLSAAAKEIGAGARGDVITIPGDLSRADEVQRVAEDAAGRLGRVDILVNNAGAIRGGDFLKMPDEQWTGDWSLKLLGYIRMARAVFPIMKASAPPHATRRPPTCWAARLTRRCSISRRVWSISARRRASSSPPCHRPRRAPSDGTA